MLGISEIIINKRYPNNLQYPINLKDSSDIKNILDQLLKQSINLKFNIKSESIDKRNNYLLEIYSY